MQILVTSASGANGNGYGSLLSFSLDGTPRSAFSTDPRIADPRGLAVSADRTQLYVNSGSDRILALNAAGAVVRDSGEIPGLDAGGGNLAPDGRYLVGLRRARTVAAFAADLSGAPRDVLPAGVVPFPRGFAAAEDGTLYLASGIGPNGEGENTIAVFGADGVPLAQRFIRDKAMSPLDLTIAPNGNIVVSSEFPFRAADAVTSIREYDRATGALVRVFAAPSDVGFHQPRGLRFGPGGHLYCVARDNVVAFDFSNGRFLDTVVRMPRLNGQAVIFFPLGAD
jgi:DNA-binding beta-propeller fold protein YncE